MYKIWIIMLALLTTPLAAATAPPTDHFTSVGRFYTDDSIVGSCVYIGDYEGKGFHLTAAHCVSSDIVYTMQYGKTSVAGKLDTVDSTKDIAVITTAPVSHQIAKATFAQSPNPGTELFACGYPGVTDRAKMYTRHTMVSDGTILHTQGRLFKGQSGGGIFSAEGLVGIISKGSIGTNGACYFGSVTDTTNLRLFQRCRPNRRSCPPTTPKPQFNGVNEGPWDRHMPKPNNTPKPEENKEIEEEGNFNWTALLFPSAMVLIFIITLAIVFGIKQVKSN